MIQIKINNEEVVSDKDIVIKEAMLNTSSVILNNVYPKSWEEDKDYSSRFYYPKDYSKCLINDVTPTEFTIDGETTQTTGLLPSEYSQAEYIESGSYPHIDTGVIPTSDTKIDLDFSYVESIYSGWSPLFGERGSSNSMYFAFFINTSSLKVSPNYAGFDPGNNSEVTLTAETKYNLKNDGGQFYLNDELESSISTSNTLTTSNKSIWLFDCHLNNDNGMSRQITARIYRCRFYEGEELIRDFIPCVRNSDNEIGMYDVVNDVFYTNQGTGSFTYGALPNPDYPIPITNKTGTVTQTIDGKEYEFNLGDIELCKIGDYSDSFLKTTGKNLFNGKLESGIINGNTGQNMSNDNYIRCVDYIPVEELSDYKFSSDNSNITKVMVYEYKGDFTYNMVSNKVISLTSYLTTNQGTKYIRFRPSYQTTDKSIRFQVEKGTSATEYEPYGKDKWYIKKEIGKLVNDVIGITYNSTYGYYAINPNIINGSAKVYTKTLSTHFQNTTGSPRIVGSNGSFLWLWDDNNYFSDANEIKEFMIDHNVDTYYQLAIPTYTEITNTTLLNQLNNVGVDLLFAGVVKNTGEISLNPRNPHYCSVQVLDFKDFLSQGETLDFVIYNKTVAEAIQQVVGAIAPYGFVLGEVQILNPDDVIGAYSTKDETAYDVFNYLADISQARWTTRMIDENTVAIDFYDPTLLPEGEGIEYTKEWFCENNIDDMSFSYSSNDYRNKQVMLSGEIYSNIETTEIIVADGYQTQFNTTDKIGSITELLVNGSAQTVITKDEYDLGYDCDFYYTPGNNYFESVDLVSTGAVITITYYAIIEGREVIINQNEISRIANMIDRKGVIARYENRNDATTTKELQAIGQTYLKYKGMPEVKLNVVSRSNLWNIGDRVNFDAPIDELDQEYMVKAKTIQRIATVDKIFYTFELTSSFNMEQDVNYFDNQRYKARGNIADGDFISRNIDIENTANIIFYDLEVTEVEVDTTSTLQSELQTPLGVE